MKIRNFFSVGILFCIYDEAAAARKSEAKQKERGGEEWKLRKRAKKQQKKLREAKGVFFRENRLCHYRMQIIRARNAYLSQVSYLSNH